MELFLVKQQQPSSECGDLVTVLFILILLVGFLLIRVYTLHTKLLDIESQHKMLKTLVSITMEEDEKELFNSIKIDLPSSEKEPLGRPVTRGLAARTAKVVPPVKPTTEIFAELKKKEDVKTGDESEYEVEEEEHEEDVKDVIPVRKLRIKKRAAV